MAFLPLRTIQVPDASERVYADWLASIEERLAAPGADWYRLTRDILFELWYPGLSDYETLLDDPGTPGRRARRAPRPRSAQRHARAGVLRRRRRRAIRPGQAAALALAELRPHRPAAAATSISVSASAALLAQHLFKRCGRNFKCFQFVEFSYGYNLEVGDDVRGAPLRPAR